MSAPAPSQLKLARGGGLLEVDFGAAGQFAFTAEFLRVHSPSAEVQGHGPGERKLIAGRRAVAIIGVEPIGHYAVRLRFDDGHSTGIYSWDTLLSLGRNQAALWRDYLAALEAKGLSRDG